MKKSIAIIGGGPAGLMAAEILSQHDVTVDLYESMPSLGRKFLMAGKSGLNLTHAEIGVSDKDALTQNLKYPASYPRHLSSTVKSNSLENRPR
jgi:predicted flavoprotein YhiN